eukprot:m.55737 g.55737  ORF g.55737 m.55737 type:complete len:89 (+) comp11145_c0_seq2:1456-1722(+)
MSTIFIVRGGVVTVVGVSSGAVVFWFLVYIFYFRKKYTHKCNGFFGRTARQGEEEDEEHVFLITNVDNHKTTQGSNENTYGTSSSSYT